MQVIRLRLLQWSMPCAIAVVAVGVFGVIQWGRDRAAEARVEQLEQDHAPVVLMSEQIKKQKARAEELSGHAARVAGLGDPRPALTLLGLVSRSARECQGRLHVNALSLQPAGHPAKKDGNASSQPNSGAAMVAIKGIAADNLAVARFVVALRQTKAFQRVDLKSTQEQPYGAKRVCSYLVECGY